VIAMYVTYPMTLAHDEIWIFCEYQDTHQVDAFPSLSG
jgi:hypothetical protein